MTHAEAAALAVGDKVRLEAPSGDVFDGVVAERLADRVKVQWNAVASGWFYYNEMDYFFRS